MHAKIYEIETLKGYIENDCYGGYELPDWWTEYYADWFDEEDDETRKASIEWLSDEVDIADDVIDFSGKKGKKRLQDAYVKAVSSALELASLNFEEFSTGVGFHKAQQISSAVEDKFHHWFYINDCEMCSLDEMLHRGGKFYLTGRTWDYHY